MGDKRSGDTPDDASLGPDERKLLDEALRRQGGSLAEAIRRRYLGAAGELLADGAPQRLDPTTRARMAKVIGADPDDVRVHVGELAQEAAADMGARAFVLEGGRDIYFGAGQYQPETPQGQALLAHELSHVFGTGAPLAPRLADREAPGRGTGALGRGEEAAERAEERAYEQAVGERGASGDEPSGGAKALSGADKQILIEKVAAILARWERQEAERRGR